MANEYADLALFKQWLTMAGVTVDRDDLLQSALDAAHEDVTAYTGRRFDLADSATMRTFRPRSRTSWRPDGHVLVVDDIGSLTGLTVAQGVTTFASVTGYETGPENALARGRAISSIVLPNGAWPLDPYSRIQVTARWGWPTVPAKVTQATLVQAGRLYRRKEAPEGMGDGAATWGQTQKVDARAPEFEALLAPYVIPGFGG